SPVYLLFGQNIVRNQRGKGRSPSPEPLSNGNVALIEAHQTPLRPVGILEGRYHLASPLPCLPVGNPRADSHPAQYRKVMQPETAYRTLFLDGDGLPGRV